MSKRIPTTNSLKGIRWLSISRARGTRRALVAVFYLSCHVQIARQCLFWQISCWKLVCFVTTSNKKLSFFSRCTELVSLFSDCNKDLIFPAWAAFSLDFIIVNERNFAPVDIWFYPNKHQKIRSIRVMRSPLRSLLCIKRMNHLLTLLSRVVLSLQPSGSEKGRY